MISRLNIQSTIEAGNAAKRPIRTLVVEDSPVAMRAMTGVLRFLPAIEIVGMAGDGSEGLAFAEKYRPDLVLADMELPLMNGLILVETLRRDFPAMRLVVVSAHDGFIWQNLSQARGADAFLSKHTLHTEFPRLLERLFPETARLNGINGRTGENGRVFAEVGAA